MSPKILQTGNQKKLEMGPVNLAACQPKTLNKSRGVPLTNGAMIKLDQNSSKPWTNGVYVGLMGR